MRPRHWLAPCVLLVLAITSIGQEPRSVEELREVLRSDEDASAQEAARALGKMGEAAKEAVPELCEALRSDRDASVKEAAARALGKMGEAAKEAVPCLSEILRSREVPSMVSGAAAIALGMMGKAAKEAVPDLLETLRYGKTTLLRLSAFGSLVQLGGVQEALSVVRETLSSGSPFDRQVAAQLLSYMGDNMGAAAKDAVPELREALRNDKVAEVRLAAARALIKLGAVKEVVSDLGETLRSDDDAVLRQLAARLLGEMGEPAEEAVSDLRGSLRDDEDKVVRQSAARALGQLLAKDAAADLRKARDSDPDTTVREAASLALSKIESQESPFEKWRKAHPALAKTLVLVGGYIFVMSIITATLLWRCPLWTLRLNDALTLHSKFKFKWPVEFEIPLPWRYLLGIGFFHYNPRILDAWVRKHAENVRRSFKEKSTVSERRVYVPIPVTLDEKPEPELESKSLHRAFDRSVPRIRLLIWGQGGTGKTSLACRLAEWAMNEDKAGRLTPTHRMLPVLIEPGFDTAAEEVHKSLTEAIRGQIEDLAGEQVLPELLNRLLRRRRILVIVDGLSEMSGNARAEIRPDRPDFPVDALVVTSRRRADRDHLRVAVTELHPLRVEADRLSAFIGAYLRQQGRRDDFTDTEFLEACAQLSRVVHKRNTTVLLAKLFAEQMMRSKTERGDLDDLPKNIPDLMLGYINDLNKRQNEPFEHRDVHRVAKVVAWECVKISFRPGAAQLDELEQAFDEDSQEREILGYLQDGGLQIIRKEGAAQTRVRFSLDPLAEYLAGLRCVEEFAGDENRWKEFLDQVDRKEGGLEAIREFLLAVRDCCAAEGRVPDGIVDELGRRARLDPAQKSNVTIQGRIKGINLVEARYQLTKALKNLDVDFEIKEMRLR